MSWERLTDSQRDPEPMQAKTSQLLDKLVVYIPSPAEIQQGLQYLFQTDSKYTLLVSGSGHSGMEAVIANLLEPGESIVVANHGIWGDRIAKIAERYHANIIPLRAELGTTLRLEQFTAAIKTHRPAVVFTCQGDSSAGIHQSLVGLGEVCREHGALLAVDTVCSLGGVPFFADDWKVDAMYSGSQKVLSAPPGCAPLFFGERAVEKLCRRASQPGSFYLDMNLVGAYWNWFGESRRTYHHTPPVSLCYGMREALRVIVEEGLEACWSRHQRLHEMLWEGLSSLGLEPFVQNDADRLATVNTIKVPEGIDAAALMENAMEVFNVEISGGLGPSVGKVWRIGILGYNAREENIALVIEAFRDGLQKQGRL